MKIKNILLGTILILATNILYSQDCESEPKNENYKKVMNPVFSENYRNCPVKIKAEFLREGYIRGYRKPKKLKKKVFFQCVADNGIPQETMLPGLTSGNFFVIEKEKSDVIFELKKGDKLEIVGTTFTQNYFGKKLNTFFIVSKINKI